MKRIYCCAAAGLLLSTAALAQEAVHTKAQFEAQTIQHRARAEQAFQETVKAEAARARAELDGAVLLSDALGPNHTVMREPVTGAPYSADEVTQFSQTLGDGTRIQRETKVTVFRDGQGRVRRETPDHITIVDPAAKTMHMLNPKTLTAYKSSAKVFFFPPHQSGAVAGPGVPLPPEAGAQTTVQHGVAGAAGQGDVLFFRREIRRQGPDGMAQMIPPPPEDMPVAGVQHAVAAEPGERVLSFNYRIAGPDPANAAASSESLGQQMFDGVAANGNRTKRTIPAGAIGNDRAIEIVSESWYSETLKTLVMSRRSDPLAGEETFRLGNIRQAEPDPSLFQIPSGFQVVER